MKQLKKWNNVVFFGLLFVGYLALTLILFHRQSVCYGGGYTSDMSNYIGRISGEQMEYATPYPIMFWIGKFLMNFTTNQHAMAITVTGLNGLNAIFLKLFFDQFLNVREKGINWEILSSVLVFLLLFSSMLFPFTWFGKYYPLGDDYLYRYKGAFSPNPFHNATFLAARPFSVLAFFGAAKCLELYEKKDCWYCREYLFFAIALVVTTMTKPSYTLVLVSTCGVIMIWRLVAGRCKGMKAFWQFGIYFIPTFLVLLYQYKDVFTGETGGSENGIGIGYMVAWETATGDSLWQCVLRGMAFPLLVLLFSRIGKKENSSWFKLAWQVYLVGFFSFLFLYEKGYRMNHLNFAWGYMYGMYFAYIVSLLALARKTQRRQEPVWQLALQWVLFAAHVICGIDYFCIVFAGNLYI